MHNIGTYLGPYISRIRLLKEELSLGLHPSQTFASSQGIGSSTLAGL